MRKLLLLSALALSLLGCATAPTDPAQVISQAQATAVAVCGFLPTAATIANILAAGNPAVMTASAIGTAICAALEAKGGRRKAVYVNGVEIHGKFVR